MTESLGKPIVVFSEVKPCDASLRDVQHEIHLISDGYLAYGSVVNGTHNECDGYSRRGEFIIVSCPGHGTESDCMGQATFDLATPNWTGDPERIADLVRYGEMVER